MPYPPATPPGGYNPYEDEPFPDPPQEEAPLPTAPPGYPFGGSLVQPPPAVDHHPPVGPPPVGHVPVAYIPAGADAKNGMGTGALIVGIGSILLCITLVISLPLGILAVILGVKGRGYATEGRATNQGVATGGIITGSIGAGLGVLGWLLLLIIVTT